LLDPIDPHRPNLLTSNLSRSAQDWGCPGFRATDYQDLLQKNKIDCGIYAKGCCWDIAVVESFFPTRKLELDLDDGGEVQMSPQPDRTRASMVW
jgi:transposase InsO family protein